MLDSAAVRALIQDRWRAHPGCADGQTQDAVGCLALIRDAPLLTPQTMADDARLRLVWSSFGD